MTKNEQDAFYAKSMMERAPEVQTAYQEALRRLARERYNKWIAFWKQQQFPMTVYRSINVPDEQSIRNEHAGVYWTFTEDKAFPAYGWRKKGTRFLLRGVAESPTQVNWYETIWQNMHDGEDEDEIQFKPGVAIKITGIRHDVDDAPWREFAHKTVTASGTPVRAAD